MNRTPTNRLLFVLVSLLGPVAIGCSGQSSEVKTYEVPKQELVQAENNVPRTDDNPPTDETAAPKEKTDRMLGAIVPRGERTWFFKATGPKEVVAEHRDEFNQFVKSIEFSEGSDTPAWKLPEGWSASSNSSSMRFATLNFGPADAPIELSVIPLPGSGEDDDYVLANVNRWRRQMGLPPTSIAQMEIPSEESRIERIELKGGVQASVVELLGQAQPSNMAAPFAR